MINIRLTEWEKKHGRIFEEERTCWFELEISHEILQSNEFGEWFSNECVGYWAYPTFNSILFSHEEDKVKAILKYM